MVGGIADRASLHLPVPANPDLPTLFLIGDSTVRNGHGDGANGQWGWGEPIVDLFDTSKINVVNRAVGGLSSRTYLTQGDWSRVLAMLKSGDFVMMQFGHNDNAPLDDAARARGTIKGTGEETREIDNPITKQHEVVHTLRLVPAQIRRRSQSQRRHADRLLSHSAQDLEGWKDCARSATPSGRPTSLPPKTWPLVDLNEIIANRYEELGPEKVEPLFGDPHTHTSRAGAELNADAVVTGLKMLKPDPLAQYSEVTTHNAASTSL